MLWFHLGIIWVVFPVANNPLPSQGPCKSSFAKLPPDRECAHPITLNRASSNFWHKAKKSGLRKVMKHCTVPRGGMYWEWCNVHPEVPVVSVGLNGKSPWNSSKCQNFLTSWHVYMTSINTTLTIKVPNFGPKFQPYSEMPSKVTNSKSWIGSTVLEISLQMAG